MALSRVAAAQAPAVEAERRCEAQPEEAESTLAADPVLRGISEFDLRRIREAHVELVEVFLASVEATSFGISLAAPLALLAVVADHC